MTENRKDELIKKYLDAENIQSEKFMELTLQEIIFIYYSVTVRIQNGESSDETKDRQITVFRAVIAKLASSETMYVAYDALTNYPHIDDKDNIWIFSTEEYARQAVDHYMQQMIALKIKKIEKKDYISEFTELYRIGVDRILIDNGYYNVVIFRKSLLDMTYPEDMPKEQIPVTNPELNFSIINFFQNFYNIFEYEGKGEILKDLESKMMHSVAEARLLVPVKLEGRTLSDGEVLKISAAGAAKIANFTDENDNTTLIPAFTDWDEFVKVYSKSEWNATVVGYQELMKMSDGCDGVLINPSGVSLRINKENRKRINEMIK